MVDRLDLDTFAGGERAGNEDGEDEKPHDDTYSESLGDATIPPLTMRAAGRLLHRRENSTVGHKQGT
jgi:hypothetical protein